MALSTKLSREDYKKAKELEELRKTGAAPPELDEDGKMINPHIPQYISQSPWYLNNNRPGLKHQRTSAFGETAKITGMETYYSRGKNKDTKKVAPTTFRKGACTNCGAMTHKKKDCVERPRKRGAKLTGSNLVADEVIQPHLNMNFDGKRDRWNGYNPAHYKQVIDKFELTEKERRKRKASELDKKFEKRQERNEARAARKKRKADAKEKAKQEKKTAKQKAREEAQAKGETVSDSDSSGSSDTDTDTDTDTDDDGSDDEGKDDDLKDDGVIIAERKAQNKYTTNRTTARDLRIREDVAKYLRNTNVHSAYYDPKTRSMRESPYDKEAPENLLYAGDNFIRKTGDAQEIAKLQLYVWEAAEKGGNEDLHILANPSQAEMLHKQYQEKKSKLKMSRKDQMLSKYGGSEHMNAPPPELLLQQSEHYVEYNEAGDVVKGQEKAIPKTKYIEDRFENNHTSVWGSFFVKGSWGYACCHQTTRNAYCTGEGGKASIKNIHEAPAQRALGAPKKEIPKVPIFAQKSEVAKQKQGPDSDSDSSSSSSSSSEGGKKKKKKKKNKKAKTNKQDTGYNKDSHKTIEPTQEEMDEYNKKKTHDFDPMAAIPDGEILPL